MSTSCMLVCMMVISHCVDARVHRGVFDQWNKYLPAKERKVFPGADQEAFPGLGGGSGTPKDAKSSGGRSGRCVSMLLAAYVVGCRCFCYPHTINLLGGCQQCFRFHLPS